MNKITSSPEGNKITGVFCQLFGHHYKVSREVTKHIKEYKCVHCQKQVTTDPTGRLTKLTDKMKEINSTLMEMYQKRNRRVAMKNQPIRKVA